MGSSGGRLTGLLAALCLLQATLGSEEVAGLKAAHTEGSSKPINIEIGPVEARKAEKKVVGESKPKYTLAKNARALNVSVPEPTNALHSNSTDLSDVSMDDEDKEVEGGEYIASHNESHMLNPLPTIKPLCTEGEQVVRGCQEKCMCAEGGKIRDCQPLCQEPLVRFTSDRMNDPLCQAHQLPDNPCCATITCSDSATEPEETCIFENVTVARGQKVEDGCTKVCICEAGGYLKCQPRCPPSDTVSGNNPNDRCVQLKDPSDSCCFIQLCDVTLDDHDIKFDVPADSGVNLTDVKVLNSTSIKLKLTSKSPEDVTVEISENNHVWRQVKPTKDGIVSHLQPGHSYYVRVVDGSRTGPAKHVFMIAEVPKTSVTERSEKSEKSEKGEKGEKGEKSEKASCSYRGTVYEIGAEWYDECISFCLCNETAEVECITIECPTDFGLDVLDPQCLDWETVPPNHVPKAPNCCPQEVRCRNNGSCTYNSKVYENWSTLPTNVTGCEKECFCEFGNVSCSDRCPPVSPVPPAKLNCQPHEANLVPLAGDECCKHWTCSHNSIKPTPGKVPTWPYEGPHYPMDPGHPTRPYAGPYSPDFKPTEPSIEDIFHLAKPAAKGDSKDKPKAKGDSKKTHHKEPGPNNLPGLEQPQFVPLNKPFDSKDFAPSNGQSIPPNRFDQLLENPAAGPAYGRPPPNDLKHQSAHTTYQQQLEDLLAHIAEHGASPPGFEADVPGISQYPGYGGQEVHNVQTDDIKVIDLQPLGENAVRLIFIVPHVLVGLHGRVEVRYTSDVTSMDAASWKSQTFGPPGDFIASQQMEFDLKGLKPGTEYKLMIIVKLKNLSNTHTSKVYQVRTLEKLTKINIEPELRVLRVNSTFAEVEWKSFDASELQYIDGVYLMYRSEDEKVYSVTPLLHRSVNNYVLDRLRPSTTYYVNLSTKDFVGHPNVVISSQTVNFTTAPDYDGYSFDVKLDIKSIKATEVELSWSGVPQPEEKYVNIYRAVYQSSSGHEDTASFKIAKKDSPARTVIGELKPATGYRLWVEVYLTNGKVKKSNVQEFTTKSGALLAAGAPVTSGKLASTSAPPYYGSLVVVSIVATLSILSTLILLMMLMKRRTSSKADISPRKTTSAYDNPSYKIELQQETMDL